MLTLSMLLALRRLFSQTSNRIDEVPPDHLENRKDAKRPRFKVKKKNLERISRIERRLDVWEDVELPPYQQALPNERCPLLLCASSTQTNAAAPQSAASMQTESVVVCSLAVQTQWIAMPTTMQKLHVERQDQRDSSLQTELLGISISVQTEKEEKSVYMQTEHRVFVFQTVSMQTEPVEMYESEFEREALDGEDMKGFEMTLPEVEVKKPVNVALKFMTIPKQAASVDQCDAALRTRCLGKNVSMQTDSRVLVLQTNWVQTEHALKHDLAVQTDFADTVTTQEFAAQTDPSGQRDSVIESVGRDVGLQTEMPQIDSKEQCDKVNQTEFVSNDAYVQTDRPTLPNLATQTDGVDSRDAAMQTNVSGNIGNEESTTQTEEILRCDKAWQTLLVALQSTEMQTERPELPDLATQTDLITSCDIAFQTEFLGNEASVQTEKPELPNLATQTDIIMLCDTAFQTEFVGSNASVQTSKPELPNLATQTDIVTLCDAAFQTEFLGNDATVQTVRPVLPNLATQTDIITLCDSSFQTEFIGNDASEQTEKPELPNLATQTDIIMLCDTAFQTDFIGNDATVQTVRPVLPNLATQTDLIELCDTAFQTEILGKDFSAQTERPSHPEISSQTETADKYNVTVQTDYNGRDISIQTKSAELPAKSTQTTSTVNRDSCLQTVFEARSISSQTERLVMPTFSTQTETLHHFDAGFQTDFTGNTISTQTVPQTRPTFSMQTPRVAKSDSVVQTEFVRRNVSVQTIIPFSPTSSEKTKKSVRFGEASQTEFFANDISIQTERVILPCLSMAARKEEKPRFRSELAGISMSMQTETLTFPSFSTQTDLVVKSDSALQTEISQRSVAIQTIKPRSPTFCVKTEQIERRNHSSQTDLVDRSISLPNFSIVKENRSCQTDLLPDAKFSEQDFVRRTRSFENLERTSLESQMDLSNILQAREIEEYELKRIKAMYSTCTGDEKAHYLGTLAEKLLKWQGTISFDSPGKSYADKIDAANKALHEIEQELPECPQESGKIGVLLSAKERINEYLLRLKTQRSKYLDYANRTFQN